MARGNQREKSREKNLKAQAGQKAKSNVSGTKLAKIKEDNAAIMRKKQAQSGESKTSATKK